MAAGSLTNWICSVYFKDGKREYEKNSVKTESKYSEKVFYDKTKNHRRP